MIDEVAKHLQDGKVVTPDPRFKPFVDKVVEDLNSQLQRVREQWTAGKITNDVALGRAKVLKSRARDKIARRIPQRAGAPMTEKV